MQAVGPAAGVAASGQSITPQVAFARWGMVGALAAGNMRVSDEKARTQLGWAPHHPSLIDELNEGSYAT